MTSKNVDEMKAKSQSAEVRRLLGVEGKFGQMMGISDDWMFNAIKQVGNYGESYERTVGMGSALKLKRGANELWTKAACSSRRRSSDRRYLRPCLHVPLPRQGERLGEGGVQDRLQPPLPTSSPGGGEEIMKFLRDREVRDVLWQVLATAGLIVVVVFFVRNASENMVKAGIASGFNFLWRDSGIEVPFNITGYKPSDTILALLWTGIVNTLLISAASIVLATAVGFTVGLMRLSRNWLLSTLAAVYIEFVATSRCCSSCCSGTSACWRPCRRPRKAMTSWASRSSTAAACRSPRPTT